MRKAAKIRPLWFALIFGAFALIFIIEALSAKGTDYFLPFVGWGGTFKYHSILGFSLYYLMMIVAVAISVTVSVLLRKKYGRSILSAALYPIGVFAVCFLGGKLLYILENLDSTLKNGISFNGFSLFGAIFITVAAAFAFALFKKERAAKLLDEAIFYELIMLAALRTGCFLNGCCGGSVIWQGSTPVILPVQLIEVFFDLLILDILVKTERKKGPDGRLYPIFLILYSIVRFMLEFLRKTEKSILGLSMGQILSVAGLLLGILLYRYFTNMKLKKTR